MVTRRARTIPRLGPRAASVLASSPSSACRGGRPSSTGFSGKEFAEANSSGASDTAWTIEADEGCFLEESSSDADSDGDVARVESQVETASIVALLAIDASVAEAFVGGARFFRWVGAAVVDSMTKVSGSIESCIAAWSPPAAATVLSAAVAAALLSISSWRAGELRGLVFSPASVES